MYGMFIIIVHLGDLGENVGNYTMDCMVYYHFRVFSTPFSILSRKTHVDGSVATPRIAHLDTRGAEASNEADRMMIHALIEQMPGGFDAMNSFVRETISDAWRKIYTFYLFVSFCFPV